MTISCNFTNDAPQLNNDYISVEDIATTTTVPPLINFTSSAHSERVSDKGVYVVRKQDDLDEAVRCEENESELVNVQVKMGDEPDIERSSCLRTV